LCAFPSASPGTANHAATEAVIISVETIVRFSILSLYLSDTFSFSLLLCFFSVLVDFSLLCFVSLCRDASFWF